MHCAAGHGMHWKLLRMLARNLHSCTQVDTVQAAPVKTGTGKFPPAMCAYVERVFAQKVLPERKAAMQAELKAIIEDANVKREMWTRDWDTIPLPSVLGGASSIGSTARSAATAAAAAISAKVAKNSRWGVPQHGAEHGQWSSAKDTAEEPSRRAKVDLPDWRPTNEWKKPVKRQKKVQSLSLDVVVLSVHIFV